MKKYKIQTITYRLLALLLVATTLWSSSIVASYATPDSTAEQEPVCGFTAHTHTQESCYTETMTLTCTLEGDDAHTHAGTCYEYADELVCTLSETEGHAHGDACYTAETALSCGKEETAGHTHGDGCYQAVDELVCILTETEGHTHADDGCYTVENTLSCGKEVTEGHAHGDGCYETVSVVTCTNTEEGHEHDASCQTEEKKLICGQTECEPHTHEEGCYTETKTLTCTLEETEGHTHEGACYKSVDKLVCTLTETEAHAHGDDCYTETKKLTCTLEETAGHTHGDSCRELRETLICPIHVHTEDCYFAKTELTCTIPEHTHSEDCYDPCTCTPVDGVHQEGCVLYVPVATCEHCGVPLTEGAIHTAECPTRCTCTPVDGVHQSGCVFYVAVEKCEHCGAELTEGAVHAEDCPTRCICGSADGVHQEGCVFYVAAAKCEHCGVELTEGAVHAKGCLTYCTCTPVDDIHAADCMIHCTCEPENGVHGETCALYKEMTLESSLGVTVSGPLPETAELAVEPLTEADLTDVTLEANEQIAFAYDISIQVDGAEYQPNGTVEVTVPLQVELPENGNWTLTVTHITDDGTVETVESQTNHDGTVTFLTAGFSVYVGTLTITEEITDGKIGEYIYMDLAADSITINADTYTGKMFKTTEDGTTTTVTVTGDHSDTNRYYIYQSTPSNQAETGIVGDGFYLPSYDRIEYGGKTWGEYVTDNTDPTAVANNWEAVADDKFKRASTGNYLTFAGAGMYDVTIDNLWSTQNEGVKTRLTGGIGYIASTGGKLLIHLKGDNRFGNIHYSYGGGGSTTADEYGYVNGTGIVFEDAETSAVPGTLTVVSYSGKANHYCSVIGGNDDGSSAHEWSCGIVINSGVIYAGARVDGAYTGSYQVDNCSAIGGGGNGTGVVTINGGTVTAVVSSTGAAIGGGIGESSTGGKGYVTITGGEVYAYNFGYTTFSDKKAYAVPAAAIGGASSRDLTGNTGTVTITGGTVYAESVGGAAIGGGSSTKSSGGAANVTISGTADVTARSIAGTVNGETVVAGASIGGGTGGPLGTGSGGNAKLVIEGGTVKTGSIGGGECANDDGKIGNAVVEISGGTIQGQVIMAEGANARCEFTMTGGWLDNSTKTSKFVFLKEDGGAVYMDDSDGIATISGGTIQNCSADNGGAVYMTAGEFTLTGDGRIQACSAGYAGGAVYLGGGTMTVSGGTITNNVADYGGGVYLGDGTMTVSGGSIVSNEAEEDGGGVYLNNGTLTVSGGTVAGNNAVNGGGAFVSGGTLSISDGEISDNSAWKNGGGACVENGSVVMSGGSVDRNDAYGAGGGMYVTADGHNASVTIYSGSVSGNDAGIRGGAVAVVGTTGGDETISVTLGVNEKHYNDANELISFHHPDPDTGPYLHKSCPEIKNNSAEDSGGGVYITGGKETYLNIYCLYEEGNRAEGDNSLSNCMMVEGGTVKISSSDPETGEGSKHGNTEINGTVHVLGGDVFLGGGGGDVTLSGATSNPKFNDAITVDVVDAGGSFTDTRESDTHYKLLYFENFLAPGASKPTGQYTAYQVPKGEGTVISGVIYRHVGYSILGWCTTPTIDQDGTWYAVGDEYPPEGETYDDLTIYAIWKLNGYTIEYHPNVPAGEVYTGAMDPQQFTYSVVDYLNPNEFEYPGYIFTGWNTKSNGRGTSYGNGAEIYNLTTRDGATIKLYAQWEECLHNGEQDLNGDGTPDTELVYTADGNTLKRECTCKGQTLYAVLTAENAVYDGNSHEAEYFFPEGTEWPVTLSYTGTTFAGAAYSSNDAPTQAGEYTATLVPTEDANVQAQVSYVIEKAPQDPPAAPGFTVSESTLIVGSVPDSPKKAIDNEIQTNYQLYYYSGGKLCEGVINNTGVFTLEQAYTNYYVMVWYGEGDNHAASEKVRSQQMHFYKGKTQVDFVVDTGIILEVQENTTADGLTIKVRADKDAGYYLTPEFSVTMTPETVGEAKITTVSERSEYILEKIPNQDGLTITVTITGAKKIPGISGAVTENQVFGTVTGNDAIISRDSAFTAYYSVSNYDAEVYNGMRVEFTDGTTENTAKTLPYGTSIILLNKVDGSYWYYNVPEGGAASVELKTFTRMGGTDSFAASGTDLTCQFIVDFSRTSAGCSGSVLRMTLTAAKKTSDSTVPDLTCTVKVTLEDVSSFKMAVSEGSNELTKTITLDYTSSAGVASKWTNRNTAVVLTPPNNIPSDATLLVTRGNGQKISWPRSGNGSYIIPLSAVGDEKLTVELVSAMFPTADTDTTYQFTAKWIVSNSAAAKAPMNGLPVPSSDSAVTVTFTNAKEILPAMKITGSTRLLAMNSSTPLTVTVTYTLPADAAGYTVTAELLRKGDDGEYISTAWNRAIASSGKNLEVSLAGLGLPAGSFCLMVTMAADNGANTVLQVPYYFIVE